MKTPGLAISLSALMTVCGMAAAQTTTQPKPKDATPPTKIETVPANKDTATKDKKAITLKVGDKAPALVVSEWIKGDAVKSFEKGKVYAVEFWATWCPPCRESIPHLSELQTRYKDAVIMGIASSEHKEKDGSDKRLENLKKFVLEKSATMSYRVGFDPDRKMGDPWMSASGQTGIPCAFIVNGEGKIAWIGHPMDMEDPLKAALKSSGKAKSDKADAKVKAKQSSTPK